MDRSRAAPPPRQGVHRPPPISAHQESPHIDGTDQQTLMMQSRIIEQQHQRSAVFLLTIAASMPPVMSKGAALLGMIWAALERCNRLGEFRDIDLA